MKFLVYLLLSSLSVALVLAFPDNHNAVDALPAIGRHANAITNNREGGATTSAQTNQIREPRHLLKKLFQPQVVVQPVLIQPPQYYPQPHPYSGSGRGYNGNFNYGVGNSFQRW
ncbi:uncharacterized protein LOC6559907 [Drosophila grimshawi]|uniref:GH21068 n=1 Tax=Drosophila grimshawi TaxID=7222 RepID=B4J5K1_DROGR|nr:uncharacterized protein LOC6559907 [Drosophila grimshawi]EDW00764.1 GH21068 [Drosophila grimshawi]